MLGLSAETLHVFCSFLIKQRTDTLQQTRIFMFPISKVLTGLLGILTVAADWEIVFCSFVSGLL